VASAEEWRRVDIPESEYVYLVSTFGRIKRAETLVRMPPACGHAVRHLPERILRQQPDNKRGGYMLVSLQLKPGWKKTFQVARLVCRAFNGEPPSPRLHCAHLNGVRNDNRPENLAWATPRENEAHKLLHGTKLRGERHHCAKLTAEQVEAIRRAPRTFGSGVELAEKYGVSTTQICSIRKGQSWAHTA
jgi:hypothetical protein